MKLTAAPSQRIYYVVCFAGLRKLRGAIPTYYFQNFEADKWNPNLELPTIIYSDCEAEGRRFGKFEADATVAKLRQYGRRAWVAEIGRVTADALPEFTTVVEQNIRAANVAENEQPVAALAPSRKHYHAADRAARFCRVSIRGQRSFVLDRFVIADGKYVSGYDNGQKITVALSSRVRVTALGTDCDGNLVALKDACKCNRTAAMAHDVVAREAN